MVNWTPKPQPFGANRAPLLEALAFSDGVTPVPVSADPATGSLFMNLAQFGGSGVTLGQKTMASSLPIVISSDQSAIPVNNYEFNGSTWTRQRAYSVFNTATATTAGNTTLWTPATGKSFRIMGYEIQITSNTTVATPGVITISLYDGASSTAFVHSVYVGTAAGQNNYEFDSGWHHFGNGYLSSAPNNVLSINLSTTLTAGLVRVVVGGSEE